MLNPQKPPTERQGNEKCSIHRKENGEKVIQKQVQRESYNLNYAQKILPYPAFEETTTQNGRKRGIHETENEWAKHIKERLLNAQWEHPRITEPQIHAYLTQEPNIHIPSFLSFDPVTYIMQIEYVPGEDLFELLDRYGKLDEETAIMLFQQLVDALLYIHSKHIYHGDVKLENILLDCTHWKMDRNVLPDVVANPAVNLFAVRSALKATGANTPDPSRPTSPNASSEYEAKVLDSMPLGANGSLLNTPQLTRPPSPHQSRTSIAKLTDFGLSCYYDPSARFISRSGTPEYVSPGILLGHLQDLEKNDVWSLGCVLYAMTHGHLPFGDKGGRKLFTAIVSARYEIHEKTTSLVRQLIQRCLIVDEAERANLKELREMIINANRYIEYS